MADEPEAQQNRTAMSAATIWFWVNDEKNWPIARLAMPSSRKPMYPAMIVRVSGCAVQ